MQIVDGYLSAAEQVLSPNFNERPAEVAIELLVIHNISLPPGQYGTGCVQDFFKNCLDVSQHAYFQQIADVQVSAHLLIERSGQIVQFVAFDKRAWHAGQSVFQGRENCNDFSIGIELEGTDDEPYTDEQYQGLAEVTVALMAAYPITSDSIKGHCDIAPGRKTDPGPAFNWPRFRALVHGLETQFLETSPDGPNPV